MAELSKVSWSYMNPELSCEHKHWLNPAQHREGKGALGSGCAALLAAVARSDERTGERVENKTCKTHHISRAEPSVCGTCAQ